jgi:phage virion morphogenesis protein
MTLDIRLKIDAAGIARAEAVMAELSAKARNPSGGLKVIGEALLKAQRRRFETGTDPDGKKWAPLKPLTVLLRGARGPILRRSGALMKSSAYQVSGKTLRVGVNTIYAAAQQFGATIVPKKGKMLAIPMGGARISRPRGGLVVGKATSRHPGKVVMARQVTLPPRPMVGFGALDEAASRRAVAQWLAVEPR